MAYRPEVVMFNGIAMAELGQSYSHDFSLMFNVRGSGYKSAEACLEHELPKVLAALRERLREAEAHPLSPKLELAWAHY